MARLTQRELRAVNYALSAILAGEFHEDEVDGEFTPEHLDSAKAKVEARIHWRDDE